MTARQGPRRLACLAVALAAILAAPAAEARKRAPVSYTRAQVAQLSTAELARLLLDPDAAASVTGHTVVQPWTPGQGLTAIRFEVPPRPLGAELCVVERPRVDFVPVRRARRLQVSDPPSRVIKRSQDVALAVAPGCRLAAGQRFAPSPSGLPLERSVQLLATLARARSAAAGSDPLPFKLECEDEWSRGESRCAPGARAVLASLPLQEIFLLGHRRSEDWSEVLIGDPAAVDEDLPFWEVAVTGLAAGAPEIVMRWTPRTLI